MAKQTGSRRERIAEEAAHWVVRLSDVSCTDEERAAFAAWRSASVSHEIAYEREFAAWEALDRAKALRPASGAPDPDLLSGDQEPRRKRWAPTTRLLSLAAALLISCGAVPLIVSLPVIATLFAATPSYATSVGERRVVVLEDGTRVELNTDTEIRVHYERDRREIELVRGEALFKVGDDRRPFQVRTPRTKIAAESAEFLVRLKEDAAEVLVKEGEAAASPLSHVREEGERATVKAGFTAIVGPTHATTHKVSPDEISRVLAWRQGAIALNGHSLAQAAQDFNRYNEQKLVVADDSIGSLRLGGYFSANDVTGFVEAVRKTFPVKAETGDDGAIYLSRRS